MLSNSKLAAPLPKEPEANGLLDIAEELIAAAEQGSRRVVPVLMLVDVKKIEQDVDKGVKTAVCRIRRVEVPDRDDWSVMQRMLLRAYERRNGNSVLPFELEQDVKKAFDAVDLSEAEQQEAARGDMSPADELRKHLEVVHKNAAAQGLTDTAAAEQHRRDHEHAEINHGTGWVGWTRGDLDQLGAYQLRYDHTQARWDVRRPDDRAPMWVHDDLGETDVSAAQQWAGEEIKSSDGVEVLRWRESPVMAEAFVPVLDDGFDDVVAGEGADTGWTDEATGLKSGHAPVFDANDTEAREGIDRVDDDDAAG